MGKFKPVRLKRKTSAKSALRAVPCLVIIVGLFALLFLLFFFGLKG
jgi:hypothetical protein